MDRGTRIALIVIRLAVGGLFLYAALAKAAAPESFIRDIWNYRAVPEAAAYWIAAYLPYLEMFAAVALIAGFQRTGGRLILGSLLIVFTILIASAWLRGLDITCGCFGESSANIPANYPLLIGRNLLLFAALAFEARLSRPHPVVPPRREGLQGHPLSRT